MIDPFTAFALAQGAVEGIKSAIALGKDVHGLVGDFARFFEGADAVHAASTRAKIGKIGKTDAQLSRQALEFAMYSNKLREDERALKDMIYWELGKPQIWEDMIRERTRLMKERHAEQRALEEAEHKHKQKMADYFMNGLIFIACSIMLFALIMGGVSVYGAMEEQRIYQEKVEKIRQTKYQRAKAEEKSQREEALEAIK
jgi:hypothetical protein